MSSRNFQRKEESEGRKEGKEGSEGSEVKEGIEAGIAAIGHPSWARRTAPDFRGFWELATSLGFNVANKATNAFAQRPG